MTPLQTAQAHCANFQSDGSCLGVYYNDDLTVPFVRPLPKCLLANPIQRCAYFEECVAPMKLEHANRATQEKLRSDFADALHQYRLAIEPPSVVARLCRDCQRNTGSRARQFCESCRLKRRKRTYRESQRRSRATKCQHSAFVSA